MPNLKANQRRRRLRLIKSIEARSATQFRSAVSALTIASDTESDRLDSEAIRKELMAECRVNMSAVLRIEHPGAAPMEVTMARPHLLVGSDSACDVRLAHEDIQPRQSFLQWLDGHLFCCDVGKRTHDFPGGDSQSNGWWIGHEPIPIGPYRLSLPGAHGASIPNSSPLDRSARLSSEYPYFALQFDGVEQAENVWPVNRMLTMIGRGSQCKLRLNHKSIAYVQAVLLRTSTGCWLIDLAKDGTTCVNGRAIEIEPLDIGDELNFGMFRVEVITLGTPAEVNEVRIQPRVENPRIVSDEPVLPIRFDRKTAIEPEARVSSSQRETIVMEPTEGAPVDAAADPTGLDIGPPDPAVTEFLREQQQELATLKQQLDALKQIYDAAAGKMVSRKMRDSLEKPVIETMQCHDSMREKLARFMDSVNKTP